MAEGYIRYLSNGKVKVYSAGIETHGVNPKAIEVMKEDGVDISSHTSNHIDEYQSIPFDLILTVCDHARENCPYFPSKAERIHHNFADPAKATGNETEIMDAFRATRDEIKVFITNLLPSLTLNKE
jgi:arsenate reductase